MAIAPYIIAVFIIHSTAVRRLCTILCALIAASLSYIFWFAGGHSTWVIPAVIASLMLTGWLCARPTGPVGVVALLLGGVVAFIWFAPLKAVSDVQRWPISHNPNESSFYLFSVWTLVIYAAIGLCALLAAAGRVNTYRPALDNPNIPVTGTLLATVAAVVVSAVVYNTIPKHEKLYPASSSSEQTLGMYSTPAPTYDLPGYRTASQVADQTLTSLENNAPVYDCNGSAIGLPPFGNYEIGEVSPQTGGNFTVTAIIYLNAGGTKDISIQIGPGSVGNTCVRLSQSEEQSAATPAPVTVNVPSVPTSSDTVPFNSALPPAPIGGTVVAYSDSTRTPANQAELVEYQPTGLDSDEVAAVQSVIGFLTYINQQDFQNAWSQTTYSLTQTAPSATFGKGYVTSRHYQLAFGQPQHLTSTLFALPARFVSRQDPAAQGNPAGVTGCTYWPQYVFLVANANGLWLDDVAGKYANDPAVAPLKRSDSSRSGKAFLNPLSQRVAC